MDPRLAEQKAEMVALRTLPGIDNAHIGRLLSLFGSAAGSWEAIRLGAAAGPSASPSMTGWQRFAAGFDPAENLRDLHSQGVGVIIKGERDYPPLLAGTHDAPWVLFHRGQAPPRERTNVAVIGSRKATTYGLEVARLLGRELAGSGANVISGAAYGIDSAAHRGALESGGFTTAVLGCGVDVAYPRSNLKLFRQISESGCILSEYPPGMHPAKHHFPARNRIIAGMCGAVVVVEAARDSGALLTVDSALAEGREVMAVPGDIFSHNSVGTNKLIRNGASAVTGPQDVIVELGLAGIGMLQPLRSGEPGSIEILEQEAPLAKALARGISVVEDLSREAGLSAAEALARLARMEISGAVVRGPGGRYRLAGEAEGWASKQL